MTFRRMPLSRVALVATFALLSPAAFVSLPVATAEAAPPTELPVFDVVSTGATGDQAAMLGDRLGVRLTPDPDGSIHYLDPDRFAVVPHVPVTASGVDENDRDWTSTPFNLPAVQALRPVPKRTAISRVSDALTAAGLNPLGAFSFDTTATHFSLKGDPGTSPVEKDIDTGVIVKQKLGRLPVRQSRGEDPRHVRAGRRGVRSVNYAFRGLVQGAMMPLITPSAAKAACAAQDGPGFKQGEPKLVYYAPPLSLPNGDPAGPPVQVDQIQPAYSCNATDLSGAGSEPPVDYVPALYNDIHAKVTASMDGSGVVTASAGPVSGGTGPYSYWWSSNTVTLYGPFLNSVGYTALGRYIGQHEVVTLKIRDSQGNWGKPIVVDVGVLPTSQIVGNGPIDFSNLGIGIESALDTWPTEMQTADDLAAISADNGLFVNFDFRGDSAWDQDFKYAGGLDSLAVDTTDDVWFGGHGNVGGYFQFQNASHVNGHAVPSDLKLGDGDLEWLQLAACLTLRDTSATNTPNTRHPHRVHRVEACLPGPAPGQRVRDRVQRRLVCREDLRG